MRTTQRWAWYQIKWPILNYVVWQPCVLLCRMAELHTKLAPGFWIAHLFLMSLIERTGQLRRSSRENNHTHFQCCTTIPGGYSLVGPLCACFFQCFMVYTTYTCMCDWILATGTTRLKVQFVILLSTTTSVVSNLSCDLALTLTCESQKYLFPTVAHHHGELGSGVVAPWKDFTLSCHAMAVACQLCVFGIDSYNNGNLTYFCVVSLLLNMRNCIQTFFWKSGNLVTVQQCEEWNTW
jgi:hypothetical protein